MPSSTRKLKRPQRSGGDNGNSGSNKSSINTSSTRSVKELIAFFEGLGRARTMKFEGLIRKLRAKGISTDDIIDFIKKYEKDPDIDKKANNLSPPPPDNTTVVSNNSTDGTATTLKPSNEERAKLRKEKGRNSAGNNNTGGPIDLYGNNSNAFTEEVPSLIPSDEERARLRKEKGRNSTEENNTTGPINLFGSNENTTKENVGNVEPPVSNENKAAAEDFFANEATNNSSTLPDLENIDVRLGEEEDLQAKVKACEEKLAATEEALRKALEEAAAAAAAAQKNISTLQETSAGLVAAATAAEAAAREELERARAESKGKNTEIEEAQAALAAAEESKKKSEAAAQELLAAAQAAAEAAEKARKAAEDALAAQKASASATNKVNANVQTNNANNNTNVTVISNNSGIHNNRSVLANDSSEPADATFPTNGFAKQLNTIGANFISLYGTYVIRDERKGVVVFNPAGFLIRLPTFTLYSKVEGALYLLLDQFSTQFKAIMSNEEKTDDQKIISIVSLREMIIRVIIHVCSYYGWLADQEGEDLSPIVEDILKKTERITVEEVKQHYFKDMENTYEILEKYIWSIFKEESLNSMARTMAEDKKVIVLEIIEHHGYSPTLEAFLGQQKFIVNAEVSGDLYKIYTSTRQEEVLRFYKDLVQQGITSEKELNITDVLYAASISPVRFTRLQELADFVTKQNGYDDEVENAEGLANAEGEEGEVMATPEEEAVATAATVDTYENEAEKERARIADAAYKKIEDKKTMARVADAAYKKIAEKKAQEKATST